MRFLDYESLSTRQPWRTKPILCEVYSGEAIVAWSGNIERQISSMLDEQEASKNYVYADKLREFLRVWRSNEITGSLNRETLDVLKTACEMLAVDSWNLKNYFSVLRDQMRKLIASEEQLPRGSDMDQNSDFLGAGPMAGAGSMPPVNPAFGPEKEKPNALKGEPEAGGAGANLSGDEAGQAQRKRATGATALANMH